MRLTNWVMDKTKIKAARDLFEKNKVFKEMLDVVESEHPLAVPLSQQGPSADDRSYRLGLIEGYSECLKKWKQLWTSQPPQRTELIATYEPPNE